MLDCSLPTLRDIMRNRLFHAQVYLASLFVVLVLVAGGILTWSHYRDSTRMLLDATTHIFTASSDSVQVHLDQALRPSETLLRQLGQGPLARAGSLAQRQASLPVLLALLKDFPHLSALYAGYDTGDFFLARRLDSAALRERLDLPAEAAFLVQSIEHRPDGVADARWISYDSQGNEIASLARPGYVFDPRTRPWYQHAARNPGLHTMTGPYLFYTSGAAGMSFAREAVPGVVVGLDMELSDLSALLTRQKVSPSAEIVLFSAQGKVLAYRGDPGHPAATRAGKPELPDLDTMGSAPLAVFSRHALKPGETHFQVDGRDWFSSSSALATGHGPPLYLAVLAPMDELLVAATRQRNLSLLLTGLLALLLLPVSWWISRRVSRPLAELAERTRAIHSFDFSQSARVRSRVREIDDLGQALESMQGTIRNFLNIGLALVRERDVESLYARVLQETLDASQAGAGVLYLLDESAAHQLLPVGSRVAGGGQPILPCLLLEQYPDAALARALASGETSIERLAAASPALASFGPGLTALAGTDGVTLVAVPLKNRDGRAIGALALFVGEAASASHERIAFVEALSGLAAAMIDNQRLLAGQKGLLEAFIKLVAGAIDAKSPYTGGHCQRVPELTKMLARAACDARSGPFADFRLSGDEWEAIHIAAWLHDCGKVTTPEYVVDKATKLETLHDRIHEVRMRFEVLKRDADIDYWRGVAEGGEAMLLAAACDARKRELNDEFAFVAACNIGGEYLSPDKIERLQQIGARHWTRTLDDTLGISQDEARRKGARIPPPVAEPLLADRPEHLFVRKEAEVHGEGNPWGFRLEIPEYKYNRGELHNLSVSRGTLTPEERYKINEHIVQTIIMLSQLPFPPHLKQVPEIAGGHHEKMDGTGYPLRLNGGQMSVPARMMAIADIFEALTAVDRPYKEGKTLSAALALMRGMRDGGHIDPDLFALFLTSGVYRRYAERYLRPEQIDEVDVARLLEPAPAPPQG